MMISAKTSRDGINNETICDMTEMEKIEEFLREQRLQWFWQVKRMDNEKAPLKAKKICSRRFKTR